MACRRMMASLVVACLAVCVTADQTVAQGWSQFRGSNCLGHGQQQPTVPAEFGPDENVLWKCRIPKGISSPCIIGDRIFLTSFKKKKKQLQVMCIDRSDGSIAWQRDIPAAKIEKVHRSSSPANATAVANERYVYFYFASCGLFCFDHEGNQVWHYEMPCSKRFNGSGTSPILIGDLLILNRDDDRDNYLLALDAKTGDEVWKTSHPGRGGFGEATPVIWNEQIVLHRINEISAYDLADGQRNWSIPINTRGSSTPVIEGNTMYVAAWNNSGETNQKATLPPFEQIVKQADKDGDGELSRSEMPWEPKILRRPELAGRNLGADFPVKMSYRWLDTDRNGKINETEWKNAPTAIDKLIKDGVHGLTAIQLDGTGTEVATNTKWKVRKSAPEVPSPLVVGQYVYTIKNGGILACVDKQTGDVQYRHRLKTLGPYFASPISVNDFIITASGDGIVTVFRAGETFEQLSSVNMGESIKATPAVDDGILYIRTAKALYAFQKP